MKIIKLLNTKIVLSLWIMLMIVISVSVDICCLDLKDPRSELRIIKAIDIIYIYLSICVYVVHSWYKNKKKIKKVVIMVMVIIFLIILLFSSWLIRSEISHGKYSIDQSDTYL